jgi:hypothetical protein
MSMKSKNNKMFFNIRGRHNITFKVKKNLTTNIIYFIIFIFITFEIIKNLYRLKLILLAAITIRILIILLIIKLVLNL